MKDNRFLTVLLVLLPVLVLGIITINPRPIAVVTILQKARLAAAQDKVAEAADLYRQLLNYQPNRTDLWNTIGDLEFQAENYPKAIDTYQNAEQSRVITTEGLFNLGKAYQKQNQSRLATDTWRKLIGWSGLKSTQYTDLVTLLREGGDLDGALQAAQAWHENYPQEGQAAFNYALLVSYLDPVQSEQILQSIEEDRTPETNDVQVLLAGLETAVGADDKVYGLVVIGQSLLKIRAYDLAEQALWRATIDNPKYAEAWALLSEAVQSQGKDGWPSLQKAQQLNPSSDIVRAEMALYFRRQSKWEEALAVLRRLAADHPRQASWLIEIGSTLTEQGDLIEAMKTYEQATELEPTNPITWRALAAFAAQNGFDAQSYSVPAAEKALSLDDEDAESLDLMGWIWLIEGDLEKAEQFLQQALKQDASDPRTALHLGQLYLEKNQLDDARRYLDQAATQEEDSAAALQAGRLLEKYFQVKP